MPKKKSLFQFRDEIRSAVDAYCVAHPKKGACEAVAVLASELINFLKDAEVTSDFRLHIMDMMKSEL